MPKKTRHKPKRTKRPAHHHGHTAGGHHERLRAHASHSHGHKHAKHRAHHTTTSATKPHRKTSRAKLAKLDRRVTEQTLRDHMALACVRRCSH